MGADDTKRQAAYHDLVEMVLPHEDRRDSKFSETGFVGSEKFGQKLKKFWG
jgi:hypothetical protein